MQLVFWLAVLCVAVVAGEKVTAAWAEPTAFPELDLATNCARWASNQQGFGDSDRALLTQQCIDAQQANIPDVRRLWEIAPEAVRKVCSASATARENYAALGLCLLRRGR
jgi:hypothetical protein